MLKTGTAGHVSSWAESRWAVRAPAESHRALVLHVAALLGFAVLYTLAFFCALEQHSGYMGNAFKAIHLESFSGDQYVTGRQPTLMSFFYVAAHLVGEAWLDDRLHFVCYFGLAFLAIFSVDRIIALLGVQGRLQRLAIIALLAIPHQFKDNLAMLVPAHNHSATTFISPLAILLALWLFRGYRARAALALSLFMGLLSVKNGWYPALVTLLFAVRDRWHVRWRFIAVGVAVSLGGIFLVFFLLHRGDPVPALVFDHAVAWIENSEANPYLERGIGNYLYLLLLIGAMMVPYPSPELRERAQAFFAVALVMFLGGGVYYTFAPDAIKIPFLQALAVNRSTWWPQVLSYTVVACAAMTWLMQGARRGRLWGAAILIALYLIPFFEYSTVRLSPVFLKRAALWLFACGVSAGIVMLIRRIRRPFGRTWAATLASPRTTVLLLSFIVATVLYHARVVYKRAPDLRFLFAHGIMGDSPGAKWVGVNEYIRYHTPPTATVLALAERIYPFSRKGLYIDPSLKIRTGRTMPAGNSIAFYFDYPKQLWFLDQTSQQEGLIASWEAHNWAGVSSCLTALGSPDYLVVPTVKAGWLRGAPGFPYTVETSIRDFTIMRRVPSNEANPGAVDVVETMA